MCTVERSYLSRIDPTRMEKGRAMLSSPRGFCLRMSSSLQTASFVLGKYLDSSYNIFYVLSS